MSDGTEIPIRRSELKELKEKLLSVCDTDGVVKEEEEMETAALVWGLLTSLSVCAVLVIYIIRNSRKEYEKNGRGPAVL